jgi:hypothetical protein
LEWAAQKRERKKRKDKGSGLAGPVEVLAQESLIILKFKIDMKSNVFYLNSKTKAFNQIKIKYRRHENTTII